jgi:hypothetical protein
MKDNKYRLFLYKPAAAGFLTDSAEYRAEFLGELQVDNLQANIKLQEISTLSFTLPENILGQLNTRIDDVLDSYVVELWYGKLEGNLGADYFPEQGDRIRFIVTKSILNYSEGIKTYSYEADSLEYFLEFKQIFNWPGIKVKDYYRTIRYNKTTSKFTEVESIGSSDYTILTSSNSNQTKYITVPTTYGATDKAPEPFEIFLYQYRRNTDDTVNSENSIVEFSRDINDPLFKEGFYVPVLNNEGKVTALNIALPDNIADFGSSNPNAIFEMFLYDNPLKRKIAIVTEKTDQENEAQKQSVLTAQTVETKFTVLLQVENNSNIAFARRSLLGSRIETGQKITASGVPQGTTVLSVEPEKGGKLKITISNNYTGSNKTIPFLFISENIVYITPPTPPLDPVIEYNFSTQLIYSIHGLKLEQILLGTQETRNQSNQIDNSVLNIDGILYDTGFTIGTIHPEIAEKFRSNIELKNITAYEAIKSLAESFDAIVTYDTINKTISFYPDKNEEVFTNNGLIITKENYLKNISNDINATKVITKAYAAGKDNLGVQLINPTGGGAWEDYSYFLDSHYVEFDKNNLLAITANSNTGIQFTSFPFGTLARWIEATEANKLAQWQYARDYFHAILLGDLVSSISAYNTRYYNFYKLRDQALSQFVKEETRYYEFKATEYKYKYIYEYYIKLNKNTPTTESPQLEIDYKKKYDDAVDASAEALKEINKLHYSLFNTRIDGSIAVSGDSDFSVLDTIAQNSFASKISEIQSFLDKTKWQINLEKLKAFEKDAVMSDSKIDNEFDLMEALETFVKENCIPVVTLDIGVADFLSSYQSKVDWDKVKVGDIINIYYPDFNIDTSAQIREASINFQSNSLSFVISTYRQYSQLPLSFIKKQIRRNYNENTNKLLYSHDSDVYSGEVTNEISEKVEEKGFEASTTTFKFGARAITGETSSEISEEGFTSSVIGVDPLLEVFIYSQEKTLSIADGTLTAKNIVKANDVLQFTSEVEVSGDNGFVIRKIESNGAVVPQVYIDTNGNAVFAGTLEVGSSAYNQVVALAGEGTTVFSAGSLEEFNLITTANQNDILLITASFNIGTTLYVKDDIYKYVNNNWVEDLLLSNKITGSVAGWKVDSTTIASNSAGFSGPNVVLNNAGWIGLRKNSYGSPTTGAFLGIDTEDSNKTKFNVGSETRYFKFDGTDVLMSGNLSIGQTSIGYNNNGIFLGFDASTPVLSLKPTSGTNGLTWNGSVLSVTGAITATSGTFTGTVNANAGNFTSTVSIGSSTTDGKLKIGRGTDANSIFLDGKNLNTDTAIYSGTTTFGMGTGFYMDASGRFSLSNKLSWNPSTSLLSVDGDIGGTIGSLTVGNISITSGGIVGTNGSATTFSLSSGTGGGFIGGFNFDNQKLTADNLTLLGGSSPYLYFGNQTPAYNATGVFTGIVSGTPRLSLVAGSGTAGFLRYNPGSTFDLELGGNAKVGPLFVGNADGSFTNYDTGNGGLIYSAGQTSSLSASGHFVTLNINPSIQPLEIAGAGLTINSGSPSFSINFYTELDAGGSIIKTFSVDFGDEEFPFPSEYTIRNAKSIRVTMSGSGSTFVSSIGVAGYKPILSTGEFFVNSIGGAKLNKLVFSRNTAPSQDKLVITTQATGSSDRVITLTTPVNPIIANRVIRLPDENGTISLGGVFIAAYQNVLFGNFTSSFNISGFRHILVQGWNYDIVTIKRFETWVDLTDANQLSTVNTQIRSVRYVWDRSGIFANTFETRRDSATTMSVRTDAGGGDENQWNWRITGWR